MERIEKSEGVVSVEKRFAKTLCEDREII